MLSYISRICGAYFGNDIHCTHDSNHVQLGLIKKILLSCNLQVELNEHHTPANTDLTADIDGPPHEHSWKIRSITDILTYLRMATHPYIAFADHQCAHPALIFAMFMSLLLGRLSGTSHLHLIKDTF